VPGRVTANLARFFDICERNFSTIYVLTGNHDYDWYKDRLYYVGEFLVDRYENVKIIKEPEIFKTPLGFNVLALPYARYPDGRNIEAYYSDQLPTEFYKFKDGLIVGHVAVKEKGKRYDGVDFSKFQDNAMALGHIHVPAGEFANCYVGSVYPNNKSEMFLHRSIKCYVHDNGKVVHSKENDVKIPEFIRYCEVRYPDKMSFPRNIPITVWDVFNCGSVEAAKIQYPGCFIKSATRDNEKKKVADTPILSNLRLNRKTSIEALQDMIVAQSLEVSDEELTYLKELLANT
jgi:hypothetical protein